MASAATPAYRRIRIWHTADAPIFLICWLAMHARMGVVRLWKLVGLGCLCFLFLFYKFFCKLAAGGPSNINFEDKTKNNNFLSFQ